MNSGKGMRPSVAPKRQTFKEGEEVYYFSGYTYEVVSYNAIPCSEKLDENPFFELPENALEEI